MPSGDVLVHAGDVSGHGDQAGIEDFLSWFGEQHFAHKIFVAGNHDFWAEKEPQQMLDVAREAGVHYLCASGVTIEGAYFWGSPQTPRFMDWAFMNADRDAALRHWQQVPDHTDVLITHGPPLGVMDELDASNRFANDTQQRERVGCPELIKRVQQLAVPLHIFGHIHEGYGTEQIGKTRFLNASQLDNRYEVTNQPLQVELNDLRSSSRDSSSAVAEGELEV